MTLKSKIEKMMAGKNWQAFTQNHGQAKYHGYYLAEVLSSDAQVFACLNQISDLAETGYESSSHDGSTYDARRAAAQAILAELAADGVTKGRHVWHAGQGRVFHADQWVY